MYSGVFQKPQLDIHDSGHDSPRILIFFNPDSSKTVKSRFTASIVPLSHYVPKVSARYIYGPTTIHDGSAMIHHDGYTNAHDASKIRYSASMVQAGSATTFSLCCILDVL